MAKCEVCGNEYDKALTLLLPGIATPSIVSNARFRRSHRSATASRVIGHGVEVGGRFFCCAHCARLATSADVKDRVARLLFGPRAARRIQSAGGAPF
jgi:hypothetical protein